MSQNFADFEECFNLGLQAGLQAALKRAFTTAELNRPHAPHSSDTSLPSASIAPGHDILFKKVATQDDLRENSWEPDAEGKCCHMESIIFKDECDEAKKRVGEVQVYWNNVAPSAPDFVKNVMMSSKYWNLLPPSLIVSVTGNAAEFEVKGELNPCDQPYVLFNIYEAALLVFPHVPIRIASDRDSASSKSDSLSDALFRMSDFLSKDDNLGLESFRKWGHKLAHTARAVEHWKDEKNEKNVNRSKDVAIRVSDNAATIFQLEIFDSSARTLSDQDLNDFEKLGFIYLKLTFECQQEQTKECSGGSSNSVKDLLHSLTWRVSQDPEAMNQSFTDFLKRLHVFAVVKVIISYQDITTPKSMCIKHFKIEHLLDDNESVDIRAKNLFESFNFKETCVGNVNAFTDLSLLPTYRDTFDDLKRRIENLSLDISEKGQKVLDYKTRSVRNFQSLPRPLWKESTLILQKSKDNSFLAFEADDFEQFLNDKRATTQHIRLVRTQGNGCRMTSETIERYLQQIAFLLPLQFGSIWIITGGTDAGIMKLCGNVFSSFTGKGGDRIPLPQIALIGIAVAGPILKQQGADNPDGLASFGISSGKKSRHFCSILKDDGDLWTLRKKITRIKDKKQLFVNMDHTHMCLVGGINGVFGDEVAFRNELESYAAQKFNIPMVQFVFGGGPMTVNTVIGFLRSSRAFSCIVKGSGYFCYAIERFKELQDAIDKHNPKNPTRALLKGSMNARGKDSDRVSNHQLFQLKTVNDHKRFCTALSLFVYFLCL